MNEEKRKFLNLFFDEGEQVCVSPDEFAYFSVSQEEVKSGKIGLLSNNMKFNKKIEESDINLIAINPINGPRNDSNVTEFRSFLVELDEGSEKDQLEYIKQSELPYSVCVFSGNKSLHFGIVLDEPCAGIASWRMINKWILNILEKADQQTLNPSRCIRYPGNYRKNGKKLKQALVNLNGRVNKEDLYIWLNKYPEQKPKPPKPKSKTFGVPSKKIGNEPQWIKEYANNGVHEDRNKTWFNIACWYADNGFDIDWFFRIWGDIFEAESDFPRREWETTVKSAFKRIQGIG